MDVVQPTNLSGIFQKHVLYHFDIQRLHADGRPGGLVVALD